MHDSPASTSDSSVVEKFSHELFGEIRVIRKGEDLWFVGSEIAKVLGYLRPNEAVTAHCRGYGKMPFPSASGVQEYIIIPESDLYRLVMRSKLPSAEQFQDWVVGEVLPTLRKSGRYEMPSVETREKSDDEKVLEALQIQNRKIAALNAKVKELAPKAEFADAVVDSPDLLTFTQVAKWLAMKSAQELVGWLKTKGVVFKQSKTWMPYAKYAQLGYFRIITFTEERDGEKRSHQHCKVTQAGKEFIFRLWKESGLLQNKLNLEN